VHGASLRVVDEFFFHERCLHHMAEQTALWTPESGGPPPTELAHPSSWFRASTCILKPSVNSNHPITRALFQTSKRQHLVLHGSFSSPTHRTHAAPPSPPQCCQHRHEHASHCWRRASAGHRREHRRGAVGGGRERRLRPSRRHFDESVAQEEQKEAEEAATRVDAFPLAEEAATTARDAAGRARDAG
jgi:hypothetical protein